MDERFDGVIVGGEGFCELGDGDMSLQRVGVGEGEVSGLWVNYLWGCVEGFSVGWVARWRVDW